MRLPGRYSSLLRMGLLGRRNLLDLPKLRFPTRAGLLPKGSVFPIDRVPFPHDPRMAGEPGGELIGIRREGCEPWGLPGATK